MKVSPQDDGDPRGVRRRQLRRLFLEVLALALLLLATAAYVGGFAYQVSRLVHGVDSAGRMDGLRRELASDVEFTDLAGFRPFRRADADASHSKPRLLTDY